MEKLQEVMSNSDLPTASNSKSTELLADPQKSNASKRVSSSSSLKPRKSTSFLGAFRRRRKAKEVEAPNLEITKSNSTLHSEDEEVEVAIENYEKPIESDVEPKKASKSKNKFVNSDSEYSVEAGPRTRRPFFKKFMRKCSQDNSKSKCDQGVDVQSSMTDAGGESKICKHCQSKEECDNDDQRAFVSSLEADFMIYTSYINFGKPTLNITLASGLQFVHELASRLLESENHFIQIFSKYIKDSGLQREMLDTLSQHSKLQWETERRTHNLANDMWIHQIEIGRTQEKTLQETLNSLVKQNRLLQIDNETMFRKNERLIRKLRTLPDIGLRHKCMECDTQMDHMEKHNEKLQYKLERYLAQIEHLENELHILQKQNDGLEQQLRHSTSQIQNIKAIFQRSKTDYELEIVDINHRLLQSEAIIKEAAEAGDILLEDLDSIKKQIKSRSLAVNWNKFKTPARAV